MSAIDISYFEAGYIDETYFTRVTDTEVPLSTQVTATCEVSVIRGVVVVMAVAFTQTASAVEQSLLELFAFTNAQLTAAAGRITRYNVALTSSTVLAVQATRIVYVISQEDAQFTMAVANRRVRTSTAAPVAAFSFPVVTGAITVASAKATPRTTATIIGNLNG